MSTTISNSALAASIAALVDRWNTRENQMIALLSQPSGTVVVTDGLGQNRTLPSFPQLQADVTALVMSAAGAVSVAEGHANTALQHRNAAADSADAAETAREAAVSAVEAFTTDAEALLALTEAARDAAAVSRTAAEGAASSAGSSAAEASTSATAAATSAAASGASQSAASAAASAAANDAAQSSAARASSEVARDVAQQWASAPPNTVVAGGEYSARHYAAQAQAAVLGSLVYMGTWSAAGGAYPGGASKGHFYKITTPGVIGGVSFAVGDQIVHNGTDWDKIDNTESVTTVAGKSGAVLLVPADIDGLGALATRSDVDWATHLSGKPATFPSDPHNHAISGVTGLQAALDGKAASGHSHAIGEVSGLQVALDGKAAASHSHAIANVTGLQAALDAKATSDHTHAVADVAGLQATLDGKAPASHSHSISAVTGLQTALDAKLASVSFTWANLGGKPASPQDAGFSSGRLDTYYESRGSLSGYQLFDRTNTTRSWVFYSDAAFFYLFSGWAGANFLSVSEATGSLSLLRSGSEFYRAAANSATATRQPRIFVGGSDPGAAAADGDIWIT